MFSNKINESEEYMDMDLEFKSIYIKSKKYTMTSIERMFALYKAIKYIEENNIEGDIVECGVWKGGSSMLSALTLLESKSSNRELYLYDTYTGMSEPTKKDVRNSDNSKAFSRWKDSQTNKYNKLCYSPIDEVQNNLFSTEYPRNKLIFIKGKVEDTIPQKIPKEIALLRLDTDWYESTYHEMTHLFPRLVSGGVLIIDDYGHWKGAREAIDQYIKENNIKILLNRIDNTGRIGIKN